MKTRAQIEAEDRLIKKLLQEDRNYSYIAGQLGISRQAAQKRVRRFPELLEQRRIKEQEIVAAKSAQQMRVELLRQKAEIEVRLFEAEKQHWINKVRNGMSISEAASGLQVNKDTMRKYCHDAGVKSRHGHGTFGLHKQVNVGRRVDDAVIEKALRLVEEQGYSYGQAGAECGLSAHVVGYHARKHNVFSQFEFAGQHARGKKNGKPAAPRARI